ncbi:10345_t:CDS:2 [Paraglomus brasilianum]|uniref:10345_t:CDS:1 n=1 Tax=Paraglomus brasilianum TaxID=144538 RepID=A0A9N9B7G2_9GLOM|nr:10345_t:CDS:2 [Paraglomus brasilianum]
MGTSNIKSFSFGSKDDGNERTITINELLDPSYGCYVWPSAFVLAEYIWYKRRDFQGKAVLELGAGTSLPGLLCTSLSPTNHTVLTDRSNFLLVLQNIKNSVLLNIPFFHDTTDTVSDYNDSENEKRKSRIWVRGLTWGEFANDKDCLSVLLDDIETLWGRKIDWLLGSDTFYDPKDFEDILGTISYILAYHSPEAKFLTTYQERSSKRSIQYLLDKWNLECRQISLSELRVDLEKYTIDDDTQQNQIGSNDVSDDTHIDQTKDNLESKKHHSQINPSMAYGNSIESIFLLEISLKQ